MRERWTVTQATEFKKALILFDRVFAPPAVKNELPVEVRDLTFYADFGSPSDLLRALAQTAGENPKTFLENLHCAVIGGENYAITSPVVGDFFRSIASRLREMGANVIPSYATEDRFNKEFPDGHYLAYQAALESIPVVDNADLEWKQVLQVREDPSAVRKLRDLRLWLEVGVKAISVSEAQELIEQKIEDYTWALKKHGLKTTTGALSTLIDWKTPAGAAAAAVLAAPLGPIAAALAGGLVVAGKIAVWAVERRIDHQDAVRGAHREVALLYDLRRRFT